MASILGRTNGQVNTLCRARETCLPSAWLSDSSFILVLDSSMEGGIPLVVRESVRNGTKRKGIETFPLESNGIAMASMGSGGYTPPWR
jgi:hypothetical protein